MLHMCMLETWSLHGSRGLIDSMTVSLVVDLSWTKKPKYKNNLCRLVINLSLYLETVPHGLKSHGLEHILVLPSSI